jgi:N-acetylneuraminic acid mutarotase
LKRGAFLAGAIVAAAGRNGTWSLRAPMPQARQAFASAVLNGRMYAVGGYSPRGQRLNEMYDPAYDRWVERAPLPASLNYPAAAAVGGAIYVFGGFAESPGIVPGRAAGGGYRYDPNADAWTRVSNINTWRGAFALVERSGLLYAIGGRAQAVLDANERYNPADDTWETLAPLPQGRDQLAAVNLRGEIHVTGGRIFQLGANSARHDVYDVGLDAWHEAPALPKTRSGHAAVVLDGRMVLFGGERNDGVDGEVIAFDPDRPYWESLATLPHPRHGLGGAVLEGTAYAFGGSAAFGLSAPSALNETFSP